MPIRLQQRFRVNQPIEASRYLCLFRCSSVHIDVNSEEIGLGKNYLHSGAFILIPTVHAWQNAAFQTRAPGAFTACQNGWNQARSLESIPNSPALIR